MSELTDRAAATDILAASARETAIAMKTDSAKELEGLLSGVRTSFDEMRAGIEQFYANAPKRKNELVLKARIEDSHRYEAIVLDVIRTFNTALDVAHTDTLKATVAATIGLIDRLDVGEAEEQETLN